MTLVPIHICSLEAVREIDVSVYDGIITIENTDIEEPFRVDSDGLEQLILSFDNINVPMEGCVEPEEKHIHAALRFGYKIAKETGGSMLIHCHAGVSRSSA